MVLSADLMAEDAASLAAGQGICSCYVLGQRRPSRIIGYLNACRREMISATARRQKRKRPGVNPTFP
jgi:hypothetical protein